MGHLSRRKRIRPLLLALPLALGGCDAARLYAKDLMNPRASAAVTVPVEVSVALFVLPPTLLWLPVSIVPLLVFHDEPAVWFALAPGIILGGPIALLAGTPGYLLTEKPAPESLSVAAIASLISSS